MRTLSTWVFSFALYAVCAPATAVEPLATYDSFSGDRIDPQLWQGSDISRFTVDAAREVSRGNLRLSNRSYADQSFSGGRVKRSVRLNFSDSDSVTSLLGWLNVRDLELVGCSIDTGTSTRAEVRFSGYFFNDGTSTGPGDYTGDVWARIRLSRESDSTDPSGILSVAVQVWQCSNPSCAGDGTTFFLDSTSLGTVSVGEWVAIGIIWDPDRDLFVFYRSGAPPLAYSYATDVSSDAFPPVIPAGKEVNARVIAENCVPEPRPMGKIEAEIAAILVNESAAPSP